MGSSFITLGGVMQARGGPELWTDTFSKSPPRHKHSGHCKKTVTNHGQQ